MKPLIYISAPYTHPDIDIVANRMFRVTKYSAWSLKNGSHVICPLTMGHRFCDFYNQPKDQAFWIDWCLNLLKRCDEMHVLCLPGGWERSDGVQKEIAFAKEHNIPIKYIEEEFIENLIRNGH